MTLLRSLAISRRIRNFIMLLAAGAATTDVSAVDCGALVMPLMVAGGAVWTEHELRHALSQRAHNVNDPERAFAEIQIQVPAAKKRIEKFGFAAIRARVLEICVALQDIAMPAPQLIEIVTHACAPFAAQLPYHYLWDAVVLVKHFRDRK
jgi:hypothetical protein